MQLKAIDVPCHHPGCNARPGQPCRTGAGKAKRAEHPARHGERRKQERERAGIFTVAQRLAALNMNR
jgi:hypothetical protein